jgi:hypothetical protein
VASVRTLATGRLSPLESRPFFCPAGNFFPKAALTLLARLLRIVTRDVAIVRKTGLFDLPNGRICRVRPADIAQGWAKNSPRGAPSDRLAQYDFSLARKIDA